MDKTLQLKARNCLKGVDKTHLNAAYEGFAFTVARQVESR